MVTRNVALLWAFTTAAAYSSTWTIQQQLASSQHLGIDMYGTAVAISGDTALVGAWGSTTGTPGVDQGAVYVFVRSGGAWSQQQMLTASDGASNDLFGYSVAISGDTALVGARQANSGLGAVYVFVRGGGVWAQQQKLPLPAGAGYQFGSSLGLSGDTAIIGAAGSAHVFVRTGSIWTLQQQLISDGTASPSGSVSISGDTAVFGSTGGNSGRGEAYVFVRSSGVWTQQQRLTATDGVANDGFGSAVSASGDTVMIGASNRNNSQGAVYVFVRNGSLWSPQQTLTASNPLTNSQFGYSLSMSGDTAAIGTGSQTGKVYAFIRSAGVWDLQQEVTTSIPQPCLYLGPAVSASADAVIIGGLGCSYVFVRPRLGADSQLVSSAAGASSVILTAPAAWAASANDSFLHLSAANSSGTGNATVVFTYDAFPGTGSRTGTLTIAGLTFTLTQAGTNYMGPGAAIPLVSSGLNGPGGLAVDAAGNVYLADTRNGAVKEWISSTQQVATLVSSGLNTPRGVTVDGSGDVYIADSGNKAVKKWSASTHQVAPLISSGLNLPVGITADGTGNLYIADVGDTAIKKWSAPTQQLTTLVSLGISSPADVAVDVSGDLYAANLLKISKWSAATQQLSTLVSSVSTGPNPATGVAVDGLGNVYIADMFSSELLKWSPASQQLTTLVSSGSDVPNDVTVDGSGNLYFSDQTNNTIKQISSAFVGPPSINVPSTAGSGSLLPVLPATTSLTGIFAPASDQNWLTIGPIANGSAGYSFAATLSPAPRVAHISILGRQITVTQAGIPFFTGSVSVSPTLQYLQFSNGNLFGYYGILSSGWLFHIDLGYIYVYPGNGTDVYLWDLSSGHWWYTNSANFPYLYDFTLRSWLYYFPDTHTAGRYTTNPRYFANLTSGQNIIL